MASLKSFIKAVRKAKTIADERSVVKKESAAIRTSFKDPNLDQTTRRVNISKLLYLYIMGEKTHFGQVECIKLLASPRFIDKRLGYLATMLLLDENQEILTLLTNSLDNDMNHPNHYIVAQALCCLGNIASIELARDLYQNVEKLIQLKNSYIRKKALIVGSKLVEKNPELLEIFIGFIPGAVNDKLMNVVLASLKMIQTCYILGDGEEQAKILTVYPTLIVILKRLITSGYNPDYDVLGVNDPFLIVNLITTLRLLSKGYGNLDSLNDILTQICSNIEIGKNVNHAILYECIKTIFEINLDQSLKILGINLLGKFLSTKDNNTKYVALNTLMTVVNIEPNAVQRHRAIIVGCLNDGDVSIRRRALELSFAILNETNIRILIKEIINYLKKTDDNDLKPFIISQLVLSIERFSPNDNWKFDNLLKILDYSENYIQMDYISNILSLFIKLNNQELKQQLLLKLLKLNYDDNNMAKNKFGLVLTTIWSIGEYFELINNEPIELNGDTTKVTDELILKYFKIIVTNSNYSSSEIHSLTSYIMNALIKLTTKFQSNNSLNEIKLILEDNLTSSDLEIQIRSAEYLKVLSNDVKLRKGWLSKMPAPKLKDREVLSLVEKKPQFQASHLNNGQLQLQHQSNDLISDLLDFNDEKPIVKNELVSDIFNSTPASKPSNSAILDLFDSTGTGASKTATPAEEVTIYSDDKIIIKFIPKSIGNGNAMIESRIQSANPANQISQFNLLLAVPKSQKLTITTNEQSSLNNGNDVIIQNIKVVGKEGSKLKFRVKFNYHMGQEVVEHMFDYTMDKSL